MGMSTAHTATPNDEMTIAQLIRALNESARKVHGKDICILLARAASFGNDDNLIIVLGKNHASAAADVARSAGKAATISVEPLTNFHGAPKGFKSLVCF
jgi:hypothetical protein